MALSNLRTGITVRQERNTASPNVQGTTLPVALIGLNRNLVFQQQADLFDWSGGTVANEVPFPGYTSGRVEAGVANPHLAPQFFVSGSLGIADISSSVTLNNLGDGDSGAPSFTIPSGLSGTFEIASGTAGCFVAAGTETESEFSDTSADFIFAQVDVGDNIKVNGVVEYEVTGIVSDEELDVRRVGKGPESVGASEAAKLILTSEDENDLRTLISTSTTFNDNGGFGLEGTRAKAGDVIRIDNWETNVGSAGLIYDFLGENEGLVLDLAVDYTILATNRVLTFDSGTLTKTVYDGDTGVGTVIFLVNELDDMVPAMYLVSEDDASDQAAAAMFAQTPIVAAADADLGAAYTAITYAQTGPVISLSSGSFTAEDGAGERTFTDLDENGLFLPGTIDLTGDGAAHILIKDVDDIFRPMFEILSITDGDNLQVRQFSDTELSASAFANNVEFTIVEFDTATATVYETGGAGTVSATDSTTSFSGDAVIADFGGYAVESDDRILDAAIDFTATSVAAGDYIFSDSGTLMFRVKAVPTQNTNGGSFLGTFSPLIVETAANIGVAISDATTLSNFGFTIRVGSQEALYTVRRVISDSELEVIEATSTPNSIPGTKSVQGMIWFQDSVSSPPLLPTSVTVGDTAKNLSYTVEKTLSGTDLTGDVLVSYAVIRDDLVGVQELTVDNYVEVLGDDVPDNPLGLAARVYFQNSSANVFVAQVTEDTDTGWVAAAAAVETDAVYNIVPLTQDPTVLATWRAHVIDQSQAGNKKERVLWQSERFERDVVKVTYATTDLPLVSRTAAGVQTVVIQRDLVAAGVEVADNFEGTFFNGAAYVDFAGRILSITLAGSETTLRMLPDENVPLDVTNMVVSDYLIRQRPLSIAELKDQVVAYPATIQERRVRNIYPDQVVMEFSDDTGDGETTGFYGGGNQTSTEGGFYMCVVEAAKRVVLGPATPLTRRGGAGIYQILDTFAEFPGFQDEIIDTGNYYMEQLGPVGTNVQTIRALTTDVSELVLAEESVTPQIDSFVRRLRLTLNPLLGPNILDARFFDLFTTQAQAVVSRVLTEREMREIQLIEIRESASAADTIEMKYSVVPYFSGARADITIFF